MRQSTVRKFTRYFLLAVLAGFGIPAVFATTFAVTNTNDSGAGSLRDAIAIASSGDTIDLTGVSGTISLTSGYLLVNTSLTINGPGSSNLSISGSNSSRVFFIGGPAITVAISGLTITNGSATGVSTIGGGILNNPNTLTLINCVISGNNAGSGGGIWNNGTLAVKDSTISGNSTIANGAGIYNEGGAVVLNGSTVSNNVASGNGGGIWMFNTGSSNAGAVTLINSTVAGNTAALGGGIYNLPATPLTLNNSTLSGNSATSGGGIYNGGALQVKNSIMANSPSGGNCLLNSLFGGTAISYGHNLSDDNSCATFFTQTGDLNSTAAGLDPNGLQNNGGPTQTIALLSTSAAVDAVPVGSPNYCTLVDGLTAVSTDQRGVARPQGPACDIGAFELAGATAYAASVQQPINANGSSIFNAKKGVVPARFTLTLGGVPTCDLPPATIMLTRTAGSAPGVIDESTYVMSADSGSYFRISNCQYIYNLGSQSLGPGTYRVDISIGGVVGNGVFALK